MQEMEFL